MMVGEMLQMVSHSVWVMLTSLALVLQRVWVMVWMVLEMSWFFGWNGLIEIAQRIRLVPGYSTHTFRKQHLHVLKVPEQVSRVEKAPAQSMVVTHVHAVCEQDRAMWTITRVSAVTEVSTRLLVAGNTFLVNLKSVTNYNAPVIPAYHEWRQQAAFQAQPRARNRLLAVPLHVEEQDEDGREDQEPPVKDGKDTQEHYRSFTFDLELESDMPSFQICELGAMVVCPDEKTHIDLMEGQPRVLTTNELNMHNSIVSNAVRIPMARRLQADSIRVLITAKFTRQTEGRDVLDAVVRDDKPTEALSDDMKQTWSRLVEGTVLGDVKVMFDKEEHLWAHECVLASRAGAIRPLLDGMTKDELVKVVSGKQVRYVKVLPVHVLTMPQFAHFLRWAYTGTLDWNSTDLAEKDIRALYHYGHHCEAPAFMKHITAQLVYTGRFNLLRSLALHHQHTEAQQFVQLHDRLLGVNGDVGVGAEASV